MQLKSLFYFASTLAVVLARATVSDVVASIDAIDAQVNVLSQTIAAFPETGATMEQAFDVHSKAGVTIDAIEAATKTAQEFEGSATVEIGHQVLDAFHTMAPLIHQSVATMIAKKGAFEAFAAGRATAVVKLDLIDLLSAATELEKILIWLAPADCKDEAYSLAKEINDCLNRGINAY